jgi:LysM repeat protein
MSHRSPARFLAPLALLAAVAVIYLVVQNGLKDSPTATTSTGSTTSSAKGAATKKKTTANAARKRSRTYVVRSGDVLGSIATKTNVSVEDLLTINRLDPASPLRVGQKLKLAP